MPTPLDLLIGPALRHSQGSREGEVAESRQPYSRPATIAVSLAAALALGWAIRTLMRRRSGS